MTFHDIQGVLCAPGELLRKDGLLTGPLQNTNWPYILGTGETGGGPLRQRYVDKVKALGSSVSTGLRGGIVKAYGDFQEQAL